MKITQEELNAWLALVQRTNGGLLKAIVLAQSAGDQRLVDALFGAQGTNNRLRQKLTHFGAEETPCGEAQAGFPAREGPTLHQLDSPANRRLLAALEEARAAAIEVDRERGVEDGLGEILGDYVDATRFEIEGPVGLRE